MGKSEHLLVSHCFTLPGGGQAVRRILVRNSSLLDNYQVPSGERDARSARKSSLEFARNRVETMGRMMGQVSHPSVP